jgi:general nucleoside transport system ATP-binding protein
MRIELIDIHKHFGPVQANAGISMTLESGGIYGLLGENGAGKSTLMKVLSGYIRADSGQVRLDGRPVHFASPAQALQCGVGMLHQDPLDFPPMHLLDNFMLGRAGGLFQQRAPARKAFIELGRQFQFDLDPDAGVHDLTVGERQQLEILRLLWQGARALILDEPTTGISAPQKLKLFETLRRLAEQGKTIIFVSHKLEEVEELCGQVYVLRRGRVSGHMLPPLDLNKLVQMMFGQAVQTGERPPAELGPPVLDMQDVVLTDERLTVSGLTLTVRAGEVIGLAGLEGSGQHLFLRACAGVLAPAAGRICLNGADFTRCSYRQWRKRGTAYMPADRIGEGLIPGLTVAEHTVLARRERQPAVVDWKAARVASQKRIEDFNIMGQPDSRVEALSGGNQQRTQLALLPDNLRLLVLEHPTRGLDVESALYIWRKLLERRRQGAAIVFASADLDEILQYSDRILVFFGGRVTEALKASETTVEQLGYLIGGKQQD